MFGLLKNNDAFTPERLALECSLGVSSPFIRVNYLKAMKGLVHIIVRNIKKSMNF